MPRRSAAYMDGQRLRFCEAAMSCFRRKGIAATSLADVCAETELSMGALYKSFKSRDELLAAVLQLRLKRRAELLRGDTWVELRAALLQHREMHEREVYWRELIAMVDWNEHLRALRVNALRALMQQIEEQLGHFAAAGEIVLRFDTKRTAHLVSLIFDGSLVDTRRAPTLRVELEELGEYLDFAVGWRRATAREQGGRSASPRRAKRKAP